MINRPPAIIGVGNLLMSDEGVGIHAIEYLRQIAIPCGADLIDAGTPGMAMLHILEDRELAIIIDCADFGGTIGEVKAFDAAELKREENREISLHAADLLGSLELARRLNKYPSRVIIIGIQPKTISLGLKLSVEIEAALPRIKDEIFSILEPGSIALIEAGGDTQ